MKSSRPLLPNRTAAIALLMTAAPLGCLRQSSATESHPIGSVKHRQPIVEPGEIADAAGVWHEGAAFIIRSERSVSLTVFADEKSTAFSGFDEAARLFLEYPRIAPAVPFSCAVTPCLYEQSLVSAVRSGSPGRRLEALVLLMRVRSPSSTAVQHQTIAELRQIDAGAGWSDFLAELEECFSKTAIQRTLAGRPGISEWNEPSTDYVWAVRAAATVQMREALPTLRRLSRSDNLTLSLAAERSLEEFAGPAADEALAYCVAGWRYDADRRAAEVLLNHDRDLLRRTLRESTPPAGAEYKKGLLLARCDDADAVAILCHVVPKYQIVDKEMFDQIARLARRQDLPDVMSLPSNVRPDQQQAAKETIEMVNRRLEAFAEQSQTRPVGGPGSASSRTQKHL